MDRHCLHLSPIQKPGYQLEQASVGVANPAVVLGEMYVRCDIGEGHHVAKEAEAMVHTHVRVVAEDIHKGYEGGKVGHWEEGTECRGSEMVGKPRSPHYSTRPGSRTGCPLRSTPSLKKPPQVAEPSVWAVLQLVWLGCD